MPENSQPPVPPTPPKPKFGDIKDWGDLKARARIIASVTTLFIFLIALGLAGGFYYSQSQKNSSSNTTPKTNISSLTPEDIAKLNDVGANLGSTGQVLNIGADSLFRSKVNVTSDVTIGGRLSANGPATLNQLNLTGPAAGTTLNLSSNLAVGGNTTMQQSLSVAGLATFGGGINAAGNSSLNNLNAGTIAVRNISISGPLTVAHLSTQGPTPTLVGGSLGAGGTASISGNDTAGTVNFNTGSNPPAGVLGTVTFRAAYSAGVHVLISPITSGAAATQAYVTRTSGGFQIHAANVPPAGSTISFDYLVTQ